MYLFLIVVNVASDVFGTVSKLELNISSKAGISVQTWSTFSTKGSEGNLRIINTGI